MLLTDVQTASWTSPVFPKSSFNQISFTMYAYANWYSWGSNWQKKGVMTVKLIDAASSTVLWSKTIAPDKNNYTTTYSTGEWNQAYEITCSEKLDLESYNAEEFQLVMTDGDSIRLSNVNLYFN